jgi:hypothetical protein
MPTRKLIQPRKGENIHSFARYLIHLAKSGHKTVSGKFLKIELAADENSTVNELVGDYFDQVSELNRDQAQAA